MGEEKTSWIETLSTIRKFHPVALLLIFGTIMLTANIYNMDLTLEKKIVPLILSASLYFIALSFEFYRVSKERELKEKGLAKEASW